MAARDSPDGGRHPHRHQVFPSNTAEVPTLLPLLERLLTRYPIRRVTLVADRRLLSLDKVARLEALTAPQGTTLGYILALTDKGAALQFHTAFVESGLVKIVHI